MRQSAGEDTWSGRLRSVRWWVSDSDGDLALAQWPNPAIGVWLVAKAMTLTGALDAAREETVDGVATGALVVWSLDELLRGASPARRALGAVVLLPQLVRLFT
jgi:hypothetical protein